MKEGIQPRPIYTKLYQLPVTVPAGQTNVVFTHVEEEMTVPMPSAVEFDDYVIYVGYDPQGAAEDKKRPPARPARPSAKPQTRSPSPG